MKTREELDIIQFKTVFSVKQILKCLEEYRLGDKSLQYINEHLAYIKGELCID